MKKATIFPYTADAITLFENRDDSLIHIDSVLCFKEDLHSVSQKVEGITFDMPTFEERGIDSIIVCDNLLNNPLSAFQKVIFDGVKHGLSVQIAPYLYTQLHQSGLLDEVPPQSKISTISLEKFCLGEQLPKVYPINVPVIAVMGLAPNSSKFDVQVELRKAFSDAGYKATVISSNSLGKFLGMHIYPDFMFSDHSFAKKTYGFNHYVHKLAKDEQPDVIIIGIPDGIIPYNQKIHNSFGEFASIVCNAAHPDFGILTSGLLDVINEDYFSQLKLLCRYRFDTEIFAFCISNNKIQENDTGDGYDIYFLGNEFVEALPGFGKENIYNVFYNSDHIGRKKAFQKLVEVLESNVNPIC